MVDRELKLDEARTSPLRNRGGMDGVNKGHGGRGRRGGIEQRKILWTVECGLLRGVNKTLC